MTVGAAAELLGVTASHVQHLGRTGQVSYLARGLVDGASVRDYRAVHQGRRTRAWSCRTAWAAVELLSGGDPRWLGQAQLSRLRSRLSVMDASTLVAATRNRARTRRFAGHEAAAARLRDDARLVEVRAVRGLAGSARASRFAAYVADSHTESVVSAFGLQADSRGTVVLYAVCPGDQQGAGVPMDLVRSLMAGEVLPALDAATSEDPRERGLALAALEESLRRCADRG